MDLAERVERLKKSRRSVRARDLDRLLLEAGFTRRFGKGDHWVYRHPELARRVVIDPRTPVLPVYVTKAIRAIEEVMR